jgi:hypothetical protein
VTILLTYDIHLVAYGPEDVERFLDVTLAEHARRAIPATFMFPAAAARQLEPAVQRLVAAGHEVGNHGLTHQDEIYDVLAPDVQARFLAQATRELEAVTRRRVRSFRAPVFRISGATVAALENLGYDVELSMNSQRLGLLSSDPWNVSWMMAPRGPYHPDVALPWRRGATRIWEIPLSCALVPFMSKTLRIFGLGFTKALFRLLHLEARQTGRPIVFMTHPEELCAERPAEPTRPFGWRDLLPSRYGIEFRNTITENDPAKIVRLNRSLFDYMQSFADVEFVTAGECADRLNGAAVAA